MSIENGDIVEQAIQHISDSNETIDAKAATAVNAAETQGVNVEVVLGRYIRQNAVNGALAPSDTQQVTELHSQIDKMLIRDIDLLGDIARPVSLIHNKDDVITHAIAISEDKELSSVQKKQQIKTLVKDAKRSGVAVTVTEVLDTITEHRDSGANGDKGSRVHLGPSRLPPKKEEQESPESPSKDGSDNDTISEAEENTDNTASSHRDSASEDGVATSDDKPPSPESYIEAIQTPSVVRADEEFLYQAEIRDKSGIDAIRWYTNGTFIGEGQSINHKFGTHGTKKLIVEVEGEHGVDHHYQNVEVKQAAQISLSIDCPNQVEVGDESLLSVSVNTRNETVSSLSWQINSADAGSGEQVTHVFDREGDHIIRVVAEGETVTETTTKQVRALRSGGITIDANIPHNATQGSEITISAVADSREDVVDSMTCEVGEEVVEVADENELTASVKIDSVENREVTITAADRFNNANETTEVVEVARDPSIMFDNVPTDVLLGEEHTITHTGHPELATEWDLTGASLVQTEPGTALVKFTDPVGEATIQVSTENEFGQSDRATATVAVSEPSVEASIDHLQTITVGENIELSAEPTKTENAQISEIEWLLGTEEQIGVGETIYHEFSTPGIYTVTAVVRTDQGITDRARGEIRVEPETGVTAVAVVPNKTNTAEEVQISGEKSVAKNTAINSYQWEIEDVGTFTGESVTVQIESPGEYAVSLTTTTDAGDTAVDEETIKIEQYTEASVTIDGPEKTVSGNEEAFTATVELTNTEVEEIQWRINDKPAGEGRQYIQQFDIIGHHTISAHLTTKTGDTATAMQTVTVESPPTQVKPEITITQEPVAQSPITFSASETEVKNGTLDSIQWSFPDETIKYGETVAVTFDSGGTYEVGLTCTTEDDEEESIKDDIYVSPSLSDPPYTPLTNTGTIDSVITRVEEIYTQCPAKGGDQRQLLGCLSVEARAEGLSDVQGRIAEFVVEEGYEESQPDIEAWEQNLSDHVRNQLSHRGSDEQVKEASPEDIDKALEEWEANQEGGSENLQNDEFEISETPDETGFFWADESTEFTENSGVSEEGSESEEYNDSEDADADSMSAGIEDPFVSTTDSTEGEPEENSTIDGSDESPTENDPEQIEIDQDTERDGSEESNNSDDPLIEAIPGPSSEDSETDTQKESEQTTESQREQDDEPGFAENTDGSEKEDGEQRTIESGSDDSEGDTTDTTSSHSDAEFNEHSSEDSIDATDKRISQLDEDDWKTAAVDSQVRQRDGETYGQEQEDAVASRENQQEAEDEDEDEDEDEIQDQEQREEHDTARTTADSEAGAPPHSGVETTDGQSTSDDLDPATTPAVDQDEIEDGQVPDIEHENDPGEVVETDPVSPKDYVAGNTPLSMPNYVQDIVDVEYIFEEDDDTLPEGVNGAGIVSLPGRKYAAIMRVEGRSWFIHPYEAKKEIAQRWAGSSMSNTDCTISIHRIPTPVKLKEHIEHVESTLDDNAQDESQLLTNVMRGLYPSSIENLVERFEMAQSQIYIVMTLSDRELAQFRGGAHWSDKIQDVPIIGPWAQERYGASTDGIDKYQVLRELNNRSRSLQTNLRRTEINAVPVRDRDEILRVIYHYNNAVNPESEVFPKGPHVDTSGDQLVAGTNIDEVVEDYFDGGSTEDIETGQQGQAASTDVNKQQDAARADGGESE